MFKRKMILGALVAACSVALPTVARATETAAEYSTPVSFNQVSLTLTQIAGEWLLVGLGTITAIGAVIWVWHRVTGKFTKRKA